MIELSHRHQNRIMGIEAEATAWRRDLHAHPEIGFEEVRTSGIVAAKLREFGCDEVLTGMARTGVVGIVKGKGEGPMIGLRADMDALPMPDKADVPYRSTFENRAHTCGHDGHTSMLLAAAKILCETRDFRGSVALIFQPAEEGMGGGREMVADGLFRAAPCETVWGLHNWPGAPLGAFTTIDGPIMAGVDYFDIFIRGVGTHAGTPHLGCDTVLAAGAMIGALQSVASRAAPPTEAATISVTRLNAATAYHVIPDETEIGGSLRYVNPALRPVMEAKLKTVAKGVAEAFGGEAAIDYKVNYPPTINPAKEAALARDVAAGMVGARHVSAEAETCMAAEDFSFMLNERPGNYIWMGVDQPGHTAAKLHDPNYDFNDKAIPYGVGYWLSLVDRLLPRA